MAAREFNEALRAWVEFVLSSATKTDLPVYDKVDFPRYHAGPRAFWSRLFWMQCHLGAEWQAVLKEANLWERLREHLDVLVGTDEFGAARKTLDDYVARAVPSPVVNSAGDVTIPLFDLGAFDSAFAMLRSEIEGNTFEFETRTLLAGLKIEPGSCPLLIKDGVTIDQFTLADIQEMQSLGAIPNSIFAASTPWFGIRAKRKFAKRIGDECDASKAGDAHLDYEATLSAILSSIALTKSGVLVVGMTYTQSDGQQLGMYSMATVPILAPTSGMSLDADDCKLMQNIFRLIYGNAALAGGPVSLAIRRLVFAMERKEVPDRLLDDMIAVEALLADDGSKTEVGYRVALRTALLLEDKPGLARRLIFDNMKQAYKVRSALAHGSVPSEKDYKIDGERVSFPAFVQRIEEYIRTAARFAVERYPEDFSPDRWDDVIIGPAMAKKGKQATKKGSTGL